MTEDCGNHGNPRKKLYWYIGIGIATSIVTILFIILLIFLILRPSKPQFILQDAAVYAFNLSAPNLLTTIIQITLSSRNPNDRIGIYYDSLHVYAAYHDQQITPATHLPPSYQGHEDITVWSPFLYGAAVPVAPYLTEAIYSDEMTGTVLINVKVDGRVRWKVGTFVSGSYHLDANCPAYINFGSKNGAVAVGSPVKYQLILDCHVDV